MIYTAITGLIIGAVINLYLKKSNYYTYDKAIDVFMAPITCAILLLILYKQFGFSKIMLIYSVQLSVSIPIVMIDLKTKTIPKVLLLLCFILGIIFLLLVRHINVVSGISGFIAAGGILLILSLLTKGGLGAGDVAFFAIMGLTLGIDKIVSALIAAAFLSGIFGVAALLINKENIKNRIPFTPFILLSIFMSFIS